MHPTPNICKPWHGEFSHDVTLEVWQILLKKVIYHNSFGHEVVLSPTGAFTTVNIFHIRKARYIFNWQNMEGIVVDRAWLLKKPLQGDPRGHGEEKI